MKKKTKQILAIICIVFLVGMYLINLVLALIGSEMARNMLMASCMCTILIPMVLYGVIVAFGGNRKNPFSDGAEFPAEGEKFPAEEDSSSED